MIFAYGRGATAYELQLGGWVLRVVHLHGGHWTRWHFRRRFSLTHYPDQS